MCPFIQYLMKVWLKQYYSNFIHIYFVASPKVCTWRNRWQNTYWWRGHGCATTCFLHFPSLYCMALISSCLCLQLLSLKIVSLLKVEVSLCLHSWLHLLKMPKINECPEANLAQGHWQLRALTSTWWLRTLKVYIAVLEEGGMEDAIHQHYVYRHRHANHRRQNPISAQQL